MITQKYILSIDQGTTSCRAILFSLEYQIIDIAQQEFTQYFPHQGWVEHDAIEIFEIQLAVIRLLLSRNGIDAKEIKTIGITNQRETIVAWHKDTGKPIYKAIVWQDTRTNERCEALKSDAHLNATIQQKTGLIVDSYFSASKIEWILLNVKEAAIAQANGNLLVGTIDSWLLWKLTDGKVHATDVSNASRTMLFNIQTLTWDSWLLDLFHIPESILPKVSASSSLFGYTEAALIQGVSIPITGIAGDQQASLFGHQCTTPGMMKNTYGTGCFMLMNIGEHPIFSENGLLTTIAWQLDGKVTYALEGSVFIAGAGIQWLRDNLGIIRHASETEKLAQSVEDSNEVFFIPAFAGLGAPYWDMNARGALFGLTRATQRAHIVRAVLESIAYQTADIVEVMEKESNINLNALVVDGGASSNNFLMQFQANILGKNVIRTPITETTALGAAMLAHYYFQASTESILTEIKPTTFTPTFDFMTIETKRNRWKNALNRVKNYAKGEF